MSFIGQYILNEKGEPEPCEDTLKWGRWFGVPKNRILERTPIEGDCLVSTVFLALDHAFHGGPPILWESMVFDAPDGDDRQQRYASREEALAGHWALVAEMKTKIAAQS